MAFKSEQHRWIYLAALALIAIGLPFSKALISLGEIILALNFIIEGKFKSKLDTLKANKSIWLFIAVFAFHAIGLFWSNDWAWGLKDLKIKLPLLIFPVVIGLSPKIRRSEFLWIVALFSGAVVVSSFFSTYKFFTYDSISHENYRSISLFTSHIRYGLMVCMAFLILLNCAWNEEKKSWLRLIYVTFAVWLGVFIFFLQSMTGIVIWLVSSYFMVLYTLFHQKKSWFKRAGLTVLIIVPLLISGYVGLKIGEFYPDEKLNFATLDKYSAGGEAYNHDTTRLTLENGNYIHLYVANEELKRSWARRSEIPYPDGKDANGNFIYSTLMRYLTSKGLRKDSLGLSSLNNQEILAIENGVANVRYTQNKPLENRIYTIIWEFDKLIYEPNPEGHSVAQRLSFWKIGTKIWRENPLFGVGSGDLKEAFNESYAALNTDIKPEFRLRSHNQFLTIAIALGIFGLLVFVASIIWPFFSLKNANTFLYIGFAIILYLSMMNEDTLETQFGATLYAYFNALFLYSLTSLSPKDTKAEE